MLKRFATPTRGLHNTAPIWHKDLPTSAAWVVFALVMANLLAYVVSFSDPVVVQDAWYFLETFLTHAANGTIHAGSFFAERSSLDHIQPLRKAILLFEWKYFALDLRIQAIIGLFCAGASLLLLRYLIFWNNPSHRNFRSWMWAGMCVVLISLNSTGIWTWPLVAGGFTSYIFMFALFVSVWKYVDSGWTAPLALNALLLNLVADKIAILVNVACIISLIFVLAKDREKRKSCLQAMFILACCLAAVRISYAVFLAPAAHTMAVGSRIDRLWMAFRDDGWWQWILVPFGSSVTYIQPLKQLIKVHANGIQIFVGIILVVCHIWFWWQAFRKRPKAASFAAIALMLTFYALLVGIIYARVPTFGNHYLDQPRYVLIYSMGNIALLLMCAAHDWNRVFMIRPSFVMMALVSALILWQIPLTRQAWRAGPWISAYEQKLSDQIWFMARHEYRPPKNCFPELVVCNYDQARRARLVKLLQTQDKNVFSARFRRANRFSVPEDTQAR